MVSRLPIKPEMKVHQPPVEAISFEWGGPFEGYARGFVARNFWRTRYLFGDERDALQECAIIFHRCARLYSGKVTEPKHLMALFKRSLSNDWNVFAQRDARIREFQIDEEEDNFEARVMRAATVKGNDEIAVVVKALLEAPSSLISLIFRGPSREKVNRRLKSLFGISKSKLDLVEELRNLLH